MVLEALRAKKELKKKMSRSLKEKSRIFRNVPKSSSQEVASSSNSLREP